MPNFAPSTLIKAGPEKPNSKESKEMKIKILMKLEIKIPEQEVYYKTYGSETITKSKAKFNSLPYLYRADLRDVAVICHDGFEAKKPLSITEAKELVKKLFSNDNSILFQYVSGGADSVGNHFVSTADTPDCMGYFNKGNIFVISTEGIKEVLPTEDVLGTNINKVPRFGSRLYLDADSLEEATFIGVRPKEDSGEIIVFTPIPAKRVIGFGNAEDDNSFNTIQ